MRQHIGKALQTRSQAIRNALIRYNEAVIAVFPLEPPTLKWEQVVEYVFLSDFDLLRDARQDIRERAWAEPTARLTMDQYFKAKRAKEEIIRLNVEIERLVTYIRDEEAYLVEKGEEIRETDAPLAHQVGVYLRERSRFTPLHMKRLRELSLLDGFTGTLEPGVRIATQRGQEEADAITEEMAVDKDGDVQGAEMVVDSEGNAGSDEEKDDDEDEDEDGDNETLAAMLDILHFDGPGDG